MSESIEIRAARGDDFEAVIALAQALFSEVDHRSEGDPRTTARKLLTEDPHFVALLAVKDSRPVGLLTLSPAMAIYVGGRFGLIHEFYVRPQDRASGIGRTLLREAERFGAEQGWLRLEVTAAPLAVSFYQKCGFIGSGPHLKRLLMGDESGALTSADPL